VVPGPLSLAGALLVIVAGIMALRTVRPAAATSPT
jgi:hypothetical protein